MFDFPLCVEHRLNMAFVTSVLVPQKKKADFIPLKEKRKKKSRAFYT